MPVGPPDTRIMAHVREVPLLREVMALEARIPCGNLGGRQCTRLGGCGCPVVLTTPLGHPHPKTMADIKVDQGG